MQILLRFLASVLLLVVSVNAQFQFFEQMFQGGQQHQQHQAPKDVPSDPSWYQQNYDSGMNSTFLIFSGLANMGL
jgi:hypothetical protein